jgi:hypothetical protein
MTRRNPERTAEKYSERELLIRFKEFANQIGGNDYKQGLVDATAMSRKAHA